MPSPQFQLYEVIVRPGGAEEVDPLTETSNSSVVKVNAAVGAATPEPFAKCSETSCDVRTRLYTAASSIWPVK